MSTETRKPRGPSKATQAAERYFRKHPEASVSDLMRKFKISHSAIYRAEWWKNRPRLTNQTKGTDE